MSGTEPNIAPDGALELPLLDEDHDPDVERLASEMALAIAEVPSTEGSPNDYWAEVEEYVPHEVIEYLQCICAQRWVAQRVMARADAKVCRRMFSTAVDAKRARWTARWRPEEQERTKRILRHARDVELQQIHCGQVCDHETFTALPKTLFRARPNKLGQLVIHDVQIKKPSLGSGAFLEQTPPNLLQWVLEHWRGRTVAGLADAPGVRNLMAPSSWDLTAGSGTSVDLFRTIHGYRIIASDLTVVAAAGIAMGDCREVGQLDAHRGRTTAFRARPETVVRRPDVILFDPPSRGRPCHTELYAGPAVGDLALLERDDYLGTIAGVVVAALRFLAEGGFVSLLLRCGTRAKGNVRPDPELLQDLKALLHSRATVTHEMPLVYASVRAQTSLASARVPAVHLVIERSS